MSIPPETPDEDTTDPDNQPPSPDEQPLPGDPEGPEVPDEPDTPEEPEVPAEDDDEDDPVVDWKPYDLTLNNAPEGGWALLIQWEYSFRYTEVKEFKISRIARDGGAPEMIKDGLPNDIRTYTDIAPDTRAYTYTVTAVLKDGAEHVSEPPYIEQDGQKVTVYKSADVSTIRPRNIRKPLRSTREKVFITWDYHPQASSYLLEAIDEAGTPYYTVHVTDVFAPLGLLIGPHPNPAMLTAKVTVMRRHPDGSEYPGASAQEDIVIDDVPQPHWGVVDFYGQPSTVTRDLAFGAVVALAEYGTENRHIAVNGIEYWDPWIDHNGFKHATIEYCLPNGSAVMASMKIEVPDNHAGGGS